MTSLCGKFTTFSKLVICAMMIRGRHRGLPYALDRAIMLPGENDQVDDNYAITAESHGLGNRHEVVSKAKIVNDEKDHPSRP